VEAEVKNFQPDLLNHKPKEKVIRRIDRTTYNSCQCDCCKLWRSWLADLKDFNRSATASAEDQVIELELMNLDEHDD
jgi:hypothetical protein